MIRNEISVDKIYNLLESDTFLKLSRRPSLIREALTPKDRIIAIDEIEKLPILMDEVHTMIETFGTRFFLTGSSARKLKRSHTSLMAGRAKSMRLLPFVSAEIPDFQLDKVLNYGTLPPVYLSKDPADELASYAGDYLQEEIRAEALSRNIENFSRFLKRTALSSGDVINFESVANDAQLPARTVREYYNVLEDTLVGTMLHPFETKKRKAISKGKFYFFDVGVMNALVGYKDLVHTTPAYGIAFEHFVFQELFAYCQYSKTSRSLSFWRSTLKDEVDFILDDDVAIEVKSSQNINPRMIKGLRILNEDTRMRRQIVVCLESEKRRIGDIEIYPFREFLLELWANQI